MRRHAARRLGVRQQEHCVGRAARLERTALLHVLAFEEQLAARLLIERRARQDWRTVDALANAIVCSTDRSEGEAVGRGRGAHGPRF